MPQPGPDSARRHLRLATSPALRRRGDGRSLLFVRAALVAIQVTWLTLLGWVAATLALLPIVLRQSPAGRRLRPVPRRVARVIPLAPRQKALPR